MTWDRRKCSLFTVEGCSPKQNRIISPIVKYRCIQKKRDREKVFTIKGCSLIRGVHYERFHCTNLRGVLVEFQGNFFLMNFELLTFLCR